MSNREAIHSREEMVLLRIFELSITSFISNYLKTHVLHSEIEDCIARLILIRWAINTASIKSTKALSTCSIDSY